MGSTGTAARKPWTPAQVLAVASARGREESHWRLVSELASGADTPDAVKAAFATANDTTYGKDLPIRLVGEMDKVTQQNSAMVEQTTSATHSLSHETEALSEATARFRLERAVAVRRRV